MQADVFNAKQQPVCMAVGTFQSNHSTTVSEAGL